MAGFVIGVLVVGIILFQYSIGDARKRERSHSAFNSLSILHWRYYSTSPWLRVSDQGGAFNTPLEMQRPRDCSTQGACGAGLSILHWRCNTPAGKAQQGTLTCLSILHWRCGCIIIEGIPCRCHFQYSIGDARVLVLGFCGFLSFCVGVWVSCGGLLALVVLVLFLCWCAGGGGVGVCVFFLLGVGLR